jgi:ribosomal protein S3
MKTIKSITRRITRKIARTIKYKIFNRKHNRDRSRRWQLREILDGIYTNVDGLQITDVKIKETKNVLIFSITLGRPGLFIGKSGCTYDQTKNALEYFYNKSVEIKIKESKLW